MSKIPNPTPPSKTYDDSLEKLEQHFGSDKYGCEVFYDILKSFCLLNK